MKKSEMLKKIEKCLVKEGIHSDDVLEWSSDAAKAILKTVEKAGMLPPPTLIAPKKGNISCLCGHGEWCEYCSPFDVERNEWEKE